MKIDVARDIRSIFDADKLQTAQATLAEVVSSDRKTAPKLADWMEENIAEGLTIFSLPSQLRKRGRTKTKLQKSCCLPRGKAPIGEDGKPIELHHADQAKGNKSPLNELTRTDHRGKGNFTKNHPNTGQSPSTVDRSEFDRIREDHWKKEWDSGRFRVFPEE